VGLISGLLTLPIAPLRGVVAVAEQVRRQAEEEFYDPARIRQQLDAVARRRESGELGDDEATALEDELVERLLEGRRGREVAGDGR
jgi:chorismate mutase